MGDELRAAAEMVVATGMNKDWADSIDAGAVAVCRAWLAEHEADDGEAVGWRPIETAPKDGTHILMWRPSKVGAAVAEAWWRTDCPSGPGWGGHGWMYSIWQQATHWMPIPPPPGDR